LARKRLYFQRLSGQSFANFLTLTDPKKTKSLLRQLPLDLLTLIGELSYTSEFIRRTAIWSSTEIIRRDVSCASQTYIDTSSSSSLLLKSEGRFTLGRNLIAEVKVSPSDTVFRDILLIRDEFGCRHIQCRHSDKETMTVVGPWYRVIALAHAQTLRFYFKV
jgi:hypothetical protein